MTDDNFSGWDLQQVYVDMRSGAGTDTVRVPGRLVVALVDHAIETMPPGGVGSDLIRYWNELGAAAERSASTQAAVRRRYRRDTTETGIVRLERRMLLGLLGIAGTKCCGPALAPPEPVTEPRLDSVSAGSIQRFLRGEPEPSSRGGGKTWSGKSILQQYFNDKFSKRPKYDTALGGFDSIEESFDSNEEWDGGPVPVPAEYKSWSCLDEFAPVA